MTANQIFHKLKIPGTMIKYEFIDGKDHIQLIVNNETQWLALREYNIIKKYCQVIERTVTALTLHLHPDYHNVDNIKVDLNGKFTPILLTSYDKQRNLSNDINPIK